MWPVLLLAASAAVQTQPSFPSGVDMVHLTVTAVDMGGEPVDGLTKEDFAVFENGAVRQLTYFRRYDTPASVVLLIDASMSVKALIPYLRSAARHFVTLLRPEDEIQVLQFTTACEMLVDFTTDHERARDEINLTSRGVETAFYRAVYTGIRSLAGRYPHEDDRRRILIILTDGEDTTSFIDGAMLLEEIRRSGVLIYGVHLRRDLTGASREVQNALFDQRRLLEQFAYESGGQIIDVQYPYSGLLLRRVYEGIGRELGTQYQLGFVSSSTPDEEWHELFVTLRSRSGIRLRYRRGYYTESRP